MFDPKFRPKEIIKKTKEEKEINRILNFVLNIKHIILNKSQEFYGFVKDKKSL